MIRPDYEHHSDEELSGEQPQGEATRCPHKSFLWDGNENHPHQCQRCGCLFSKAQADSMAQTEGGEFQELPAANEKAQLRPSSPPATAPDHWPEAQKFAEDLRNYKFEPSLEVDKDQQKGSTPATAVTARELTPEIDWKSRYEKDCVVEIAAVNPSVAGYCEHWESRAEGAEEEVIKLAQTMKKLQAEVEKLRQERDAWEQKYEILASKKGGRGRTFAELREARERAEKELRELLPFVERHRINLQPCVKCDHKSCELVRRALASLKSSEGAK